MTIRMFFTILAVLSFLFGVGFVLAPDQVLPTTVTLARFGAAGAIIRRGFADIGRDPLALQGLP